MKIEIRTVRHSDLEWYKLLHSDEAFNRWITRRINDPQSMEEEFLLKMEAQRARRGVFAVADVDGTSQGYGVLLFSVTGESAHVEFGVDLRYQRKGIGSLLLDEALHAGNRIGPGLRTIKALCHRDNEGCIRLLRARGFTTSTVAGLAMPPLCVGWQLRVGTKGWVS
ncbi:GNAT family N-acetyltransferase [Cupriavidus alkaliphilus]|uniref:GNAT family N-acetyltransferase n=1 Tax=Cupriavidus alkaliphilus TaxID=942866 RepID=UPI000DD5A7C4|nr:GNAT family N-acetyltransferase [Cupriavidus alkaliphilus]